MKRLYSLFLVLTVLSPAMALAQAEPENAPTPEEQCRSQLRVDPFRAGGAILAIYRRCLLHHSQLEQQEKEGELKTQKRESLQERGATSFPQRGSGQGRELIRRSRLHLDRGFQRVYRQDIKAFNLLQQNSVRDTRSVGRHRSKTTEYAGAEFQKAASACGDLRGLLLNICIRKELRGGTELKTFQK